MAHGSSGITTGDANQNKQNRRKSFNFLAYKPKTKQNKQTKKNNDQPSRITAEHRSSVLPSTFQVLVEAGKNRQRVQTCIQPCRSS